MPQAKKKTAKKSAPGKVKKAKAAPKMAVKARAAKGGKPSPKAPAVKSASRKKAKSLPRKAKSLPKKVKSAPQTASSASKAKSAKATAAARAKAGSANKRGAAKPTRAARSTDKASGTPKARATAKARQSKQPSPKSGSKQGLPAKSAPSVRQNPRGQAHSKTQSAADVKKAAQSAKKGAQSAKKDAQTEAPASTAAPLRRKRQAAQPRPPRRSEEPAHSVEARTKVREQLLGDVEAFLKGGGRIQEISKDVRSDPPKKPESKYGSGSL